MFMFKVILRHGCHLKYSLINKLLKILFEVLILFTLYEVDQFLVHDSQKIFLTYLTFFLKTICFLLRTSNQLLFITKIHIISII